MDGVPAYPAAGLDMVRRRSLIFQESFRGETKLKFDYIAPFTKPRAAIYAGIY
jgi:hypothetical protein